MYSHFVRWAWKRTGLWPNPTLQKLYDEFEFVIFQKNQLHSST